MKNIGDALLLLKDYKLDKKFYKELVSSHQDPENMAYALISLKQKGLLDHRLKDVFFQQLKNSSFPFVYATGVSSLSDSIPGFKPLDHTCTPVFLEAMLACNTYEQTGVLLMAIGLVMKYNFQEADIRRTLWAENPTSMACAINLLRHTNKLSEEKKQLASQLLAQCSFPAHFVEGIEEVERFYQNGMITFTWQVVYKVAAEYSHLAKDLTSILLS